MGNGSPRGFLDLKKNTSVQGPKIVSLKELYGFVAKHKGNHDAVRLERTELGKIYCRFCDKITDSIDESQGFYLWGAYDTKGYWQNIYLGKAGYGDKWNLKKRIREELKDERCCIWRYAYTEDELMAIRDKIHQGKYSSDWKRAMRKEGTTHIAWVPAPKIASENVERVEADLIEALNPIANRRRPTPPIGLQFETAQIFKLFRLSIHAARESKFFVKPM
jgi:hypothetical protein